MGAIKLIVGFLVILWVGLATFLYLTQDSILYQPPPVDTLAETTLTGQFPGLEPLLVITKDGQTLSGWFLPRRKGRAMAPPLVYFGGNAEDAASFIRQAAMFPEMSLVSVNYRGYGRSTGRPSEQGLRQDALAVYDQAVTLTGSQGVVFGRSLGAGLAAYVAAERPVQAAILVTPYDSLLNVAKGHYPFMPVAWLMRDRYEALPDAAKATAPVYVLAGTRDDIIPESHAQAIYMAWKGPKRFHAIPTAGHNDIQQYPSYAQELRAFLKEHVR